MNHKGLFTALVLLGSITAIAPAAHASTSFADARLITQPDPRHTKSTKGTLTLDDSGGHGLTFNEQGQSVAIAYDRISSMRLERSVTRNHVPFSGRVQHSQFLTLQYQDNAGQSEYAVFELKGKYYREVIAALEAKTSKQVEWKNN
jgi:hypothetical protein